MKTIGDKNFERIDLGLGALLAGADHEKPQEECRDLSVGDAHSCSTETAEAPAKSEFDLLADERRWSEIVRRTEPRLADPADIEARLWWIRGHLGAFSMPAALLVAPLESLCRTVNVSELNQPLFALLKETGLLSLIRLQEVDAREQVESLKVALERVGIRENRNPRERKRAGTSSFRASDFCDTEAKTTTPSREVKEQRMSAGRKRAVWTIACSILVIGLVTIDHLFPELRSPPTDIVAEAFVPPSAESELAVVMPEPKDPGGRLGSLFYSIEGDLPGSPGVITQNTPVKEREQVFAQPQAAANYQEQVVKEPVTKERVDTTGPVEGPEFRERMDRERLTSPEGGPLRGGPPDAVLPDLKTLAANRDDTLEVLVETVVRSAPSQGGRVIGRLEAGDRVLVEGRLGRWLRLRSKQGRGGYVLAADVGEFPADDYSRNY